jgi:hypothetical protein
MIYFTFAAAFLLSAIAGYYSVIGLAAIFMGAFWPVIIMGGSLEFAKLVTASWLYRNWKTAPFLLRTYLVIAVMLLMLITSMGIFGFLAKAHIDSTLDAGANSVELKTLNQQQKIADERLNYLLARAKDPSTASNQLDRQIQNTQKELTEINKKRLPLLREENKLVADIGPIKYVADMFFNGDGAVDKAVRLVIFIIMLVFDPLAVLLLIAANISMRKPEETKPVEKTWDDFFKSAPVPEEGEAEEFFEKAKIVAKKLDEDSIEVEKENITQMEEPIIIDGTSGESIPPISKGKRGFPNRKSKIDSMYVDGAELAFRKKENE